MYNSVTTVNLMWRSQLHGARWCGCAVELSGLREGRQEEEARLIEKYVFSRMYSAYVIVSLRIPQCAAPRGIHFASTRDRGNIVCKRIPVTSAGLQKNGIMEKPWGYPSEYCPLGGSKAKNLWGMRPLGFLALELVWDNIHQDTPSVFPPIVSR